MGIKRVVKKGFSGGLSVKRWVGLENIKDNGVLIGNLASSVFKGDAKQKSARKETFEEALQRLNLTEEDVQKRIKQSKRMITFFLSGVVLAAIYLFYLISNHRVIPSYVSVMLIFLFLAYAFREHFNLFQMKQRRLGCSFKEYFSSFFKRAK